MLLFAVLSIFNANAQWESDTAINLKVSNSLSSDSQSIAAPSGGTYIVYYKSVPAPVNFEIWVQYLSPIGTKMFGDDGMLLTNTLPMSTYTTMWKLSVDGKGNLYVGATGTGAGTPAYVYKVMPTGELPWGASGLNVGSGYLPTIHPLSNFEVLISWMPAAGGKAKIQHYTEMGVAIWLNPIEVMPSTAYANSGTVVADMFEQSNGYFTAVFHTRTSAGLNSFLFAQRYDSAGVAQWTQPTQLADKGSAYNNLTYGGTQDGDVIYYGYSLATGLRYDAFAQRLNTDGTTPWGINGIDFDTNISYYEMNAKIAYSPGSQYVWMISSYTSSSQSTYGEYVQKFDKVTGARQFTDNAHQVYPVDAASRVHVGNLYLANSLPVFALKSGADNGVSATTLSAQFLDVNGNFFPATYVKPLATFAANKGRIVLNKPASNQGVITFVEAKTTNEPKISAQNFSLTIDPCTINVNAIADFSKACSVNFEDLTLPTGTDICAGTVTATIDDQSIFPITANTTVQWTFTSTSGGTATQTQNIIITNTITPPALEDVTSQCSVMLTDLTVPVATDSCGNTITATTNATFPLTQGTTAITWTFTSPTGTIATQTQNIIVNDTTAPTLTVQNISATVAEDGTVNITAAQFDNGSTDSCGNDTATWTWSVSPASFTCTDLGEQTVTITATDAYGNIATTTATVSITDPNGYCTTSGIGEFNKKVISIYPNPAQEFFTIESAEAIKSVVVYDMLGKTVFRGTMSATTATVDSGMWSAGVYNVTVENAAGDQQRLKLVKN